MSTGLPTQPKIFDRVQFLAAVAGRLVQLPAPYPDLALLGVTLPGLAAFQQTYGNAAADQMQLGIFKAINHLLPDVLLGQITAGHFALCYEYDSSWADTVDFAQELRAVIAAASVGKHFSMAGQPDIGAAIHHGKPPVGTSLEVATDLLHQASLAAQMAAGRSNDRILVFSAAEAERIRDVTRLDHLLRRAIAGREFRLNYQPIVDLRSRELVGLEGLVRWAVPEGDLQPPNAFMSIAEASGLISEISTLVIEIATRQLTDWKSAGWVAPRLTLNVAAAQLQEADFLAGLVKAASSGHLNPAQLELDIIGGGGTVWSTAARQRLAVLRDMQVTLALDDFGTGDASLQWLRDLPVSRLKLAPTFTERLAADRRNRTLVTSIIAMAHALDLDIIAKGIEHHDQVEALLECGCRTGQGYLFSQPVSASDLLRGAGNVARGAAVRSSTGCLPNPDKILLASL